MSQINQELVLDFLSYKLSQRGYRWSQFRDVEGGNGAEAAERAEVEVENPGANPPRHLAGNLPANGANAREVSPMAAVKQTLREAEEEFRRRYRWAFNDLTAQLQFTPATAYLTFLLVLNELFRDGVNWGRIVAFFYFGGALCVGSADKEMQELVGLMAIWMVTYLNDHLDPWIKEKGGWEAFVDFYRYDAAAESRKNRKRINRLVLMGATLIGVALLGLLLSIQYSA